MSRKRLFQAKRHPLNADINVVPYIDVMMVLLIIFMITAPLLTQGVIVDLPQAKSDPVENNQLQEPLIVSVTQNGTYFLDLGTNNHQSITLERVGKQVEKILSASPNTPVLIRGDHRIDYGIIVQLMTVLQQSGASSVGLVLV